jgi:pyridoxal phosphate enzyme (YggS family)
MTSPAAIESPFHTVLARIRDAELRFGRTPGSVALLAVSKQQPIAAIAALAGLGQRAFGENYLQEALPKIAHFEGHDLSWHFIGRIQSNKTRDIAAHFAWVHALDRPKIAERLAAQRPAGLPPLECLIEVNVSGEASKGGVSPADLPTLVGCCRTLPQLRLRGLMALPAPEDDFEGQRLAFRKVREALAACGEPALDTLSMGTSGDFEAAIAEGATLVRIGTALFGPRAREPD